MLELVLQFLFTHNIEIISYFYKIIQRVVVTLAIPLDSYKRLKRVVVANNIPLSLDYSIHSIER